MLVKLKSSEKVEPTFAILISHPLVKMESEIMRHVSFQENESMDPLLVQACICFIVWKVFIFFFSNKKKKDGIGNCIWSFLI